MCAPGSLPGSLTRPGLRRHLRLTFPMPADTAAPRPPHLSPAAGGPSGGGPSASGPSASGRLGAHLAESAWLGLLLTVPLVMNVAAARTFEAAKLAAAAPIVALMLFALIAAAIEGQARWPVMPGRSGAVRAGVWAFIALTGSAILSTVMSETPWIAFFGDYFRREGLVSWLIYAITFAALLLLLRRRHQLERLIDVLLLASVLPCVYALQQRYGFDFFSTAGLNDATRGSRPGSNLGNPTFLSAWLLLVIPVTVARLFNSASSLGARAPWLLLLGTQLFVAILTQSRGPVLALIATLFLLAVLLGGLLRRRGLILAAAGVAAITLAGLLLLNLTPDLQGLAKGTPLQRFVFTGGQDFSSNSRIGIWGMGIDAFLQQPLWRQWIGSGPDATHFNYFPHLPAWVLRIEGLTETIDRLHSESLESVMTLGLAGLLAQLVLLSALVWLAVTRLGRVRGAAAAAGFGLACVLALFAGGFGLMMAGGSRGLFAIGGGLGIAVAWSAALLWSAWRMAGRRAEADAAGGVTTALGTTGATPPASPPASPALPARADAVLLAALVCALIGSWIEVQVGVPTISTRLTGAVYAALILLLGLDVFTAKAAAATMPAGDAGAAQTGTPGNPGTPGNVPAAKPAGTPASSQRRKRVKAADARAAARNSASAHISPATIAGWSTGLALMVATAAYFPPLSGNVIHPPSPQRLHLIIVPLLALLGAGAVVAWFEARRTGAAAMDALTRFLLWSVLPWFGFLTVYAQIGAAIRGAGDALAGERINALLLFSFGAYPVAVLALGLGLYRADSGSDGAGQHERGGDHSGSKRGGRPSRPLAMAALALSVAAGAAAYWIAMYDVRADTYAKLASWAQNQNRPDANASFLDAAVKLMPQERRFTGSLAARLTEQAAKDLGTVHANPALAPAILERLAQAEKLIAQSYLVAPRDPWVTFAYANVHQFQGLSQLEAHQPKGERERHIALARRYFGEARAQFPNHPWILRNFAQLEIDAGDRPAAYAKFDLMEQLDPQNTGVYADRLRFTRAFGDHAIAIAALRRGIAAQPAGSAGATELTLELARYFQQTGQPTQAIATWQELLKSHPDNFAAAADVAETHAHLGQRELALGNAQAALARIAAAPRSAAAEAAKVRLDAVVARLAAAGAAAGVPGMPTAGSANRRAAGNPTNNAAGDPTRSPAR